MSTTREKIHAQIRSNVITSEPWKVGHNSGYKRPYFVYNVNGGYALSAAGHIRRFGSLLSASAVADQMNLEDQQITREALANRNALRQAENTMSDIAVRLRPGPGRSFEQAELEDEINSNEGCSVKVWSDDGIGKTKRLHIHDPRGTQILKNVIINASNTQVFEAMYDRLKDEVSDLSETYRGEWKGSGSHVECLEEALEAALELLGLKDILEEN